MILGEMRDNGTLIVDTEHYEQVKRVFVQHGEYGTMFYENQTWITNDYGEKIAFDGVGAEKARRILEIFGDEPCKGA